MKNSCFLWSIDLDADDKIIEKVDNIMSSSECQTKCKHHEQCDTFVLNTVTHECFLKYGYFENAVRSFNGYLVSGPKSCGKNVFVMYVPYRTFTRQTKVPQIRMSEETFVVDFLFKIIVKFRKKNWMSDG